jgi:hypothetical protein
MNGATLRNPRRLLGRRALTAVLAVFGALAAGALLAAPAPALGEGLAHLARGVEGCAEPQFIMDELGTVRQPLSFTESVGCLPEGETWSSAVIHWGDGTTSPGTIASASPPSPEGGIAHVTVTGQHTYNQPGSFSITVTVTDQANEVHEGGWHTNAVIGPPSSPAPERHEHEEQGAEHPACLVPALKGDTLAVAGRALAKAHCRLGKVTRPAHRRTALIVARQSARHGKWLPGGAAVAVTLAPRLRGEATRPSR